MRFLNGDSAGCLVAEAEDEVCGTVTSIVYERSLAWVGMMLVASARRSRGGGRQLLEAALEALDSAGIRSIRLDATPQGQPLYAKLGFIPEYELERWILDLPATDRRQAPDPRTDGDASLDEIIEADRGAFGVARGDLLRGLDADAPEFTTIIRDGGRTAGCTLGRHGLHADHLGPWLARDETAADRLLTRFLARSHRDRIIVDVPKSNPQAGALLRARGFSVSRPFMRMIRGAAWPAGLRERMCAIAGPEFG